ncbi:MAG: GAF domain-containing protein [Aeromicrobium sp.]
MSSDDLTSQLFTELTDTTVSDLEVGELLRTLADRCCDVVDIAVAAVVLVDRDGQLELQAWSGGAEDQAGLFDQGARHGPCLDASLTNRAVAVDDLTTDEALERWPWFTPAARAAGFRSAGAVPMRSGHRVVGALGLLRHDPTPIDAGVLVAVQALADAATAVLLRPKPGQNATIEERLARALGDRVIIEQAKGIIAERDGIDVDQALVEIRQRALVSRQRLVDIATAVIGGTLTAADLGATPNLRVTLPCSSEASRIARRAVDGWLAPFGVEQQVRDDARLIVSELVSNAVTHARSAPTLEATWVGRVVRIEVGDDDPTPVSTTSTAPRSATDAVGGHGLRIVQRLSDAWGCVASGTGKVVWSEIR